MNKILEEKELALLTGYQRPKQQAQFLTENGIKYLINAQGKVIVTRDWLNGWDKVMPASNEDAINWDFLDAS